MLQNKAIRIVKKGWLLRTKLFINLQALTFVDLVDLYTSQEMYKVYKEGNKPDYAWMNVHDRVVRTM